MAALQAESRKLNCYDIFGLRAFLTLGKSELDSLALGQRFVSVASDSAEVSKYIGARFLLDKAKAFRVVKPFNGSGGRHSHDPVYSKVKEPSVEGHIAGNASTTYEEQDEVLTEEGTSKWCA